jgi:hypothetical protein
MQLGFWSKTDLRKRLSQVLKNVALAAIWVSETGVYSLTNGYVKREK